MTSGAFQPDPARAAAAAPPAPLQIAAFDVDGTLTWTDSFVLFLRFVTSPLGYALRMAAVAPRLVPYGLGLGSRDAAKAAIVSAFLKDMPHAAYLANCAAFAERAYPLIQRADGVGRLRTHAGVGQTAVLVSASLEDYLAPWGRNLGVEATLATRVEVRAGRLTGRLDGANCRGPEKLRRLRAHFGPADIRAAYGDSAGDREMLAAAAEPGYRSFLDEPRDRSAVWREIWYGTALGKAPYPAGS